MNFKPKHFAIAAACALFSYGACAEVLRYEFTGTVTQSSYVAQVGEEVTGTFSYETSTPPINTCFNNVCGYYDPNGAMTMAVGMHRMSGDHIWIGVQNDQGIANYEDIVNLSSGSPAVIDGTSYAVGGLMLSMIASKPQVLQDTSIPRDYQVHRFDIVREGGFSSGYGGLEGTLLYFQIDSIKLLQPSQQ